MASLRRSVMASILFTAFGGPGIALLLVPWLITQFRLPQSEPAWHAWIAAILIAGGLVPVLESIVRFVVVGRGALIPTVPTEYLVVSGLYRFVRNPMYVGVLTALAGEAVLLWSRGILLEAGIAGICFHLFVSLYEEPKLARTYGEQYDTFRQNVPRWIPRLSRWRDPAG